MVKDLLRIAPAFGENVVGAPDRPIVLNWLIEELREFTAASTLLDRVSEAMDCACLFGLGSANMPDDQGLLAMWHVNYVLEPSDSDAMTALGWFVCQPEVRESWVQLERDWHRHQTELERPIRRHEVRRGLFLLRSFALRLSTPAQLF